MTRFLSLILDSRVLRLGFMALVMSFAAGCAVIPPEPVVTGPLTAAPPEPAPMPEPAKANGAIFQPTAYGNFPLFEDRRPRNIGDIVTVIIEERTNAAKSVQTSTDRSGSANMGVDMMPRWIPSEVTESGFGASGGNTHSGTGSSEAKNQFNGTITTTVIGVLPNGNLKIAGNKEIAINRGSEYVRFSGVVDPRSITGTNTVRSVQVADARIEYRSRGTMDEVQTMGWLQRFFLNVSPF